MAPSLLSIFVLSNSISSEYFTSCALQLQQKQKKNQHFFYYILPLGLRKPEGYCNGHVCMCVCMCVTGPCKHNSSFVFHPILMKLSKYLFYPSKTNPIENRHGWVILGCSGRCKRWNFTEFRLENRTAPSFFIRF